MATKTTKIYCKSRSEAIEDNAANNKGSRWSTKNKVHQKASKVVEGTRMNYLTLREDDQAENMKAYKKEMFDLETLIETGAASSLQEMNYTPSTLQILDNMEEGAGRELDRMEAEEWAKKYIQQAKQQQKPKEE